jgi:hypothetical protein
LLAESIGASQLISDPVDERLKPSAPVKKIFCRTLPRLVGWKPLPNFQRI